MKLQDLKDNPGARKSRMRVGRGIGCTKGKTCGRGVKGQKARTGVSINGFEGGQMPIHRRLPKRGFNPLTSRPYAEVNLGQLQRWIDAGRLDIKQPITEAVLLESGLVRRKLTGIKLLAKGEVKAKVTLELSKASAAAIKAVEKAGGKVTTAQAA